MISQQELESAIKRWKSRQAGEDFADAEATFEGVRALPTAMSTYGEPETPEYDVDDGMSVEASESQGGVPEFVPSLSDSSLIDLDPDVGDSDERR